MRGIVLAGGSGTRLHPLTYAVSKQLLNVYDKPMVYYPISVLMLGGIREILIISTASALPAFERLLGDGSSLGVCFRYAVQSQPNGLAEAFMIGEEFIGADSVALILGDNIFYGDRLGDQIKRSAAGINGCVLYGYPVKDPGRYGVAETDDAGHLVSLEEKPTSPKSNRAVTGLYLYDNDVVAISKELTPSPRGELEITDVNRRYLERGKARLVDLGRGYAWFDTGTYDSLLQAGQFVQVLEHRQGVRIGCLEEVALRMGHISAEECLALGRKMEASDYGRYVIDIASSFAT
jgi:glucose-1-phosphate thymidylyltransferase